MKIRQENLPTISYNIEEVEVELKLEYENYLTSEQLSNFYFTLNELLKFHNINDVEIIVKEGSLITILKRFTIIAITSVLSSLSNPETQNLKAVSKMANSFNNSNNFCLFKCTYNNTSTIIYSKENIAQKSKEFNEAQLKEADIIEEVKTLKMRIVKGSETNKKTNNKGKITKNTKCKFMAIFDDGRFSQQDEITIIVNEECDEDFKEINLDDADKYYFIANGKLIKDRVKYVEFEITELLKKPTLISTNQLELF